MIALRLMLLTFVRTVELRTAPWSEFNFERAEWRIAPERMKMREGHIVPLSRQVLILLQELRLHTGGRPFLFPNYRNATMCMTATTLNRALERMGLWGGSLGLPTPAFPEQRTTTAGWNRASSRATVARDDR